MSKAEIKFTRGSTTISFVANGETLEQTLDICQALEQAVCARWPEAPRAPTAPRASAKAPAPSADDTIDQIIAFLEREGAPRALNYIIRECELKQAPAKVALARAVRLGRLATHPATYIDSKANERPMTGVYLPDWEPEFDTAADAELVFEHLTLEEPRTLAELAGATGISTARATHATRRLLANKQAARTENGEGYYLG